MWFQNVFNTEFNGPLLLGDKQYTVNFSIKANDGRGSDMVVAYGTPTYNLSGNDSDNNSLANLTLVFSLSPKDDFKFWNSIDIDVTAEAASTSSVSINEVINSLNANNIFTTNFSAENNNERIIIRQKKHISDMKFFVANTGAETILKFNKYARVKELPTYFHRHIITYYMEDYDEINRFKFGLNQLIQLDPSESGGTSSVDDDIIENALDENRKLAGYDPSNTKEDYELLEGKSGIFNFQKITVDGSDRIEEIIEYPAGAKIGDLARKTIYTYTSGNKNPSKKMELPYTLESGDLITP